MHNIKEIRKDFSKFQKSLEKRNINVDFKKIQKLDEQNRDLIQTKESLEKEKKDISKSKDESLFKKSNIHFSIIGFLINSTFFSIIYIITNQNLEYKLIFIINN